MDIRKQIDDQFAQYRPSSVVGITAAVIAGAYIAKQVLTNPQEFKQKILGSVLNAAKALPGVNAKIEEENKKMVAKITKTLKMEDDPKQFSEIPDKGLSQKEIIEMLEKFSEKESHRWKDGKLSGKVYNGNEEVTKLINQVYSMYTLTNALHADVYPSVRKFEAEIIRMTATMLHGDNNTVGALTSGGTESILMALKAYRDFAQKERGIAHPEVVMGISAHPAFDKAGGYFGIKIVRVRLDANGSPDLQAVESAINSNTIGIVASAPSYPHGVVDNVPEIAKIALKHSLLLHVDGCLGGFVMPWIKELGYNVPAFDFAVPGVTSMSCDTHKYGFGPKGCSCVLFRPKSLRNYMYFVTVDWPGGIYASPTATGSRPGAPMAATWAVMVNLGKEGYRQAAKGIMETQVLIKKGIQSIEGCKLIYPSESPVLGITTTNCDPFMVADAMKRRKWVLDTLQKPNGFHICLTVRHIGRADDFLNDLKWAVSEAIGHPDSFKDGMAPIYGMAAELPDRSIVGGFITAYLDALLDTM